MRFGSAQLANAMDYVPGLLIVEGNSDRLAREGASRQIDRLISLLSKLIDGGQLRVKRIKIDNDLTLDMMRAWAHLADPYDAVLVLAHGNLDVAEATPTTDLRWEDVATLMAQVQPRAALMICCMAAASAPSRVLFDGVPTLQALGGSPAPLSFKQAELAIIELLCAAFGRDIPREWSALLSLCNAGETGGVVVWRRRDSFQQANDEDLLVLDLFAVIAKTIMDIERLQCRRRLAPRRRPKQLAAPVAFRRPNRRWKFRR